MCDAFDEADAFHEGIEEGDEGQSLEPAMEKPGQDLQKHGKNNGT